MRKPLPPPLSPTTRHGQQNDDQPWKPRRRYDFTGFYWNEPSSGALGSTLTGESHGFLS